MIEPTIGRIVWYWPSNEDHNEMAVHVDGDRQQPCAAIVAYVVTSRTLNLTVLDHNGCPHARLAVRLLQDAVEVPLDDERYCEWMPYQKGQAALHGAQQPIGVRAPIAEIEAAIELGRQQAGAPSPVDGKR
jgi:hypothetical protein